MKLSLTSLTTLALAILLSACSDSDKAAEPPAEEASIDPAIEAVLVTAEPEGAITVSEARKTPEPGKTLTVSGKIAGAMSPFTEGYATVVLSDRALQTCELIPGDSCPTPWDACCVDSEIISAQRMTLQIVDGEGLPIAQSLKGAFGLKELTPLIATGTVAEGSNAENLILNVTKLYPEQP